MPIDIDKLKDSKQFLNLIMENMDAAIFIVDAQMKIYQFNDGFLTLFSPRIGDVMDISFGPAAGCVNTVKENKPCGETSLCGICNLRQALKNTAANCRSEKRLALEREFYINGQLVKKYLEFTCRPIEYDGLQMILLFIYDVTPIEQSKRQLKEKQKQIDIDLEKAAEIQRSLLPARRPKISRMNVDWFFEPSFKVGGDVFHIYTENDPFISCYMLDVSGHGVSAALVAVMAKQFLDHLHIKGLKKGRPYQPRDILRLLDRQFPFERFDSYLTIVSLLLNVETGQLVYACAGHVPPVIVGKSGELNILKQHGAIIGIGQNVKPKQYKSVLSAGDKLVIYTDGLVDYFGKKGALSNNGRFYDTLQALNSCSAGQMVEQIMSQRKRQGESAPADDISLLVLEYLA